ncbi:7-carboxy-7-deazaguanine synthase QueE [Paenibacillus sp. JDR-2]|uniref:7-carboxy-7-deazaguanine synthase QueE n=1 Tax=Paenibacillus sp. (strain JDR-2) TaxID=324057 RepID=UPI0001667AEA|nr:7-carboxy-7-deazaguanine synthase QueE [Paenibacillus sp. JDR-2]ACT02936.1 7-cyano-7-deazaguanosine (preQ0) biosynthesis protein QueE [Paenibacillus sp. JDR-2]
MADKRIPVMEIFGPTVQGEGMVIGQKTMFVRTAGCDYSCSWCDSAFTWDGTGKDDTRMLTASEIVGELRELGGNTFSHVTLSGGNPALLKNADELVDALHRDGVRVAVETQGSRWQDWLLAIDELTLSPKPPSSGMTTNWEVLDEIVARLAGGSNPFSLKVVVFDEQDLAYAAKVHNRYPGVTFFVQTGNDDLIEGDNGKLAAKLIERYEWLIDQVMKREDMTNVRVLPQLHALVWGNKRGV